MSFDKISARRLCVAGICFLALMSCASTTKADESKQSAEQRRTIADGRDFKGAWTAHLDADRSVSYHLTGAFKVTSDVSDAPAGETDIYLRTKGLLRFENTSTEGRDTDDSVTKLQLFVPPEACPWLRPNGPLAHCSIELAKLRTGGVEAGGSSDAVVDEFDKLGSTSESGAAAIIAAFESSAVLIATNGILIDSPQNAINPSCDRNGIKAITYFTEMASIDGCSGLDRRR